MKYPTLTFATALLCLTTPVLAAQEDEGSLARARALFTKVDIDGDGLVSALEAGRNRIPSKDFVAYDADRDRKLSPPEFTLFYRQLLVKNGKEVGDDLAGEAARIEAGRRARKAEKAQQEAQRAEAARQAELARAKRAAKAREDSQGTDTAVARKAPQDQVEAQGSGLTDGERAELARLEKDALDAERAGEARQEDASQDAARAEQARQEKLAQDAARTEEARKAKLAQDAARTEEARKAKLAQDAARTEEARKAKLAQDAARAEEARKAKLAQDAARTEEARKAKLAQDAARAEEARRGTPVEQLETRAAGYVKRLVDSGRLSAQSARDFRMILNAPAAGKPGAVNPEALRKALSTAKKRISSLVVSGALSSEEGRQLSSALDSRAKAGLPPGGDSTGRRGRTQSRSTGAERAGRSGDAAGTRRVGEVKRTGVTRPAADKDRKRRDG